MILIIRRNQSQGSLIIRKRFLVKIVNFHSQIEILRDDCSFIRRRARPPPPPPPPPRGGGEGLRAEGGRLRRPYLGVLPKILEHGSER